MKSLFVFIVSFVVIITACTSSKENTDTSRQKYIAEEIPPGSAIVLCNVDSFTENGDVYLIEVNVKSVLGYGSATDEIAPGTNLKLQMAKRLIDIKSLKKGAVLKAEIRQPKMKMENGENILWTVSQLIK